MSQSKSQTPEPRKAEPTPDEVPFIAEGTAKEIEQTGSAIDPRTGLRVGVEALPAGRKH